MNVLAGEAAVECSAVEAEMNRVRSELTMLEDDIAFFASKLNPILNCNTTPREELDKCESNVPLIMDLSVLRDRVQSARMNIKDLIERSEI